MQCQLEQLYATYRARASAQSSKGVYGTVNYSNCWCTHCSKMLFIPRNATNWFKELAHSTAGSCFYKKIILSHIDAFRLQSANIASSVDPESQREREAGRARSRSLQISVIAFGVIARLCNFHSSRMKFLLLPLCIHRHRSGEYIFLHFVASRRSRATLRRNFAIKQTVH